MQKSVMQGQPFTDEMSSPGNGIKGPLLTNQRCTKRIHVNEFVKTSYLLKVVRTSLVRTDGGFIGQF